MNVQLNMKKSSLLHLLLLLLLAFSLLLSTTAAVSTSRSLNSLKDKSALQDLHAEVVGGEFAAEGRMDLASTDYPGTGANNRHDPKSPGGRI